MSDDPVILRPVAEDDLSVLERFLTDPEATGPFQWLGWSDPGRWRRRWAQDGLLSDDGGQLMVTTGTDRLGFVAWRKVVTSRNSYCWNIGAQLLPDGRGRGVGTQAQRLLVRYLFAHTPVVRLEADTETENIAEQRALEKSGFTREGVLRSAVFRDGQWRDVVRYSVLRDEIALDESPEVARRSGDNYRRPALDCPTDARCAPHFAGRRHVPPG
jgi:RimJ/RimL family protein N-acetyltransferase